MDEIKTPLAPEELRVLRNQLELELPPLASPNSTTPGVSSGWRAPARCWTG